jgi:ElaB/YqjD/DUF883 family membrane-anchored ribosome-binding protein
MTMLEQRPGQLGAESEGTRPAFVDTLEAMENGLKDAIHGANGAVTAAADAVNETAEATGQAVDGVARALDVPGHVSRHPWVALGAAILAGFVLVRLCRRQ